MRSATKREHSIQGHRAKSETNPEAAPTMTWASAKMAIPTAMRQVAETAIAPKVVHLVVMAEPEVRWDDARDVEPHALPE